MVCGRLVFDLWVVDLFAGFWLCFGFGFVLMCLLAVVGLFLCAYCLLLG